MDTTTACVTCVMCGGTGWYRPAAIPTALVNCVCNPTWEGATDIEDWDENDGSSEVTR